MSTDTPAEPSLRVRVAQALGWTEIDALSESGRDTEHLTAFPDALQPLPAYESDLNAAFAGPMVYMEENQRHPRVESTLIDIEVMAYVGERYFKDYPDDMRPATIAKSICLVFLGVVDAEADEDATP